MLQFITLILESVFRRLALFTICGSLLSILLMQFITIITGLTNPGALESELDASLTIAGILLICNAGIVSMFLLAHKFRVRCEQLH